MSVMNRILNVATTEQNEEGATEQNKEEEKSTKKETHRPRYLDDYVAR